MQNSYENTTKFSTSPPFQLETKNMFIVTDTSLIPKTHITINDKKLTNGFEFRVTLKYNKGTTFEI